MRGPSQEWRGWKRTPEVATPPTRGCHTRDQPTKRLLRGPLLCIGLCSKGSETTGDGLRKVHRSPMNRRLGQTPSSIRTIRIHGGWADARRAPLEDRAGQRVRRPPEPSWCGSNRTPVSTTVLQAAPPKVFQDDRSLLKQRIAQARLRKRLGDLGVTFVRRSDVGHGVLLVRWRPWLVAGPLAARPTAALFSRPLRARAAVTATVDAHGRRRVEWRHGRIHRCSRELRPLHGPLCRRAGAEVRRCRRRARRHAGSRRRLRPGRARRRARRARRRGQRRWHRPRPPVRRCCRARIPGADVREGVAESLPWGDGTFDAAMCSLVVAWMSDADRASKRWRA